ncbi:hypothetical protein QO227_21290 [Vibrio vulnificus]|uniref:DUF6932 family protein n=1 Tax=Vibrio vulnificus TaxID=672 RepID=UPI0024DF987F|nr:hypothetical protein [Vibrio vulnificus]MDK2604793.1 hypothetical protein [Vibrio vulnificus]MDK2626888.1 hypothetical protein [Vibrio vulnificus]MDK2721574.1 hypothetical protein [Vibrio vulnificus]MDK2726017.1 hypothetical protein [Vibrio vulnificus]
MNPIPAFESNGLLSKGIHKCSGQEFLERFCEGDDVRTLYYKAITDIFDFARDRNAKYVFVGGSFVSNVKEPSDFDAVIVFEKKEYIPRNSERLVIEGQRIDIMFCSEDEPKIVDSFVHLFSRGVYGQEKGIVQVDLLGGTENWEIRHYPDDEDYEIVKRAYCHRDIIDLNKPEGVLVTIHGLNTTAGWNSDVMPAFSSKGWIVAPFDYGFQTPEVLLSDGGRKDILNKFRDWIYDIDRTYNAPISVIAHSFGTYIIGKYLDGFQDTSPVSFESIVLTGSILNESFDWDSCHEKVGRVRNEMAPNDQWVKWMPSKSWLGLDPLFGKAGINGFTSTSRILTQHSNTIFDHNNMIKKDVINQMWLPYIQSNKAVLMRELIAKLKAEKA